MQALVEAVDQLEGSSPAKEDEEVEKAVCPACGEIFSQSGYTVIVHSFGTQNPTPTTKEEQEAPDVELRKEDELEVGLIPNIELEEAEQLQPQPSELMDQPNIGNIESNQSATTQEPTPSEFFVESSIKKESVKPEIEVIPDPNLEFLTVTPEPS